MKITEIFTSIQGESTYAGLPCTFVRLAGCNLRCVYCDTQYSHEGGLEMSEEEITNEVSLVGVNLVEITGGEPLLQPGVIGLIQRLLNDGYQVLIETNGSMSIRDIDHRAIIILDIKTPKSGMFDEMDLSNLDYIKPADEIKFVVLDRYDYDWAKDFITKHGIKNKCKILMSPAFGFLQPETLARWVIEDRLDIRLNIQIHKYIFPGGETSVQSC